VLTVVGAAGGSTGMPSGASTTVAATTTSRALADTVRHVIDPDSDVVAFEYTYTLTRYAFDTSCLELNGILYSLAGNICQATCPAASVSRAGGHRNAAAIGTRDSSRAAAALQVPTVCGATEVDGSRRARGGGGGRHGGVQ